MATNTEYNPRNQWEYDKNYIQLNLTGVSTNFSANTTTNLDLELTDDCLLTGGTVGVEGGVFGDTLSIQVVHPIAGVVAQFITDWHVLSDVQKQMDLTNVYPAKIPAGLKLRLVYTSTNLTTGGKVAVNYILHKVLR